MLPNTYDEWHGMRAHSLFVFHFASSLAGEFHTLGTLALTDHSLQQPQIVLLREGTDTSQGKAQLISNINACMAVNNRARPLIYDYYSPSLFCSGGRVREHDAGPSRHGQTHPLGEFPLYVGLN